ncbi:MAG: L,D-transpeptidase family protein [Fimbriimonadaceae bacterium]|nr:L,D-transpeptidase family protein [Alphaproteobacteria bacterium]
MRTTKGVAAVAFATILFLILNTGVQAAAIKGEAPESRPNLDPIKMVISLSSQRIDVYQGRDLIHSSPISSGKAGYNTPSGIFSILQRNRWHRSNIYSNAPMPFMQRLTWSGIALHAGRVPGYPASHGCVRLPNKFATTLYNLTSVGAHVVIAKDQTRPEEISHRALFQPLRANAFTNHDSGMPTSYTPMELDISDEVLQMADLEADLSLQYAHENYSSAPLRILITRRTGREKLMDIQRVLNELGYEAGDVDGYMGSMTASAVQAFQRDHDMPATGMVTDELLPRLHKVAGKGPVLTGHIYVRQNFEDIFDSPLQIRYPDEPLGTYMYSALHFEKTAEQVDWLGLVVEPDPDGNTDIYRALDRVVIPAVARTFISERLTPGSSLIISDNGISRETGRGTDFVVLTN